LVVVRVHQWLPSPPPARRAARLQKSRARRRHKGAAASIATARKRAPAVWLLPGSLQKTVAFSSAQTNSMPARNPEKQPSKHSRHTLCVRARQLPVGARKERARQSYTIHATLPSGWPVCLRLFHCRHSQGHDSALHHFRSLRASARHVSSPPALHTHWSVSTRFTR